MLNKFKRLISELKLIILNTVFKDESIIKDIVVTEKGEVIPCKKVLRFTGRIDFKTLYWDMEHQENFHTITSDPKQVDLFVKSLHKRNDLKKESESIIEQIPARIN